MSDYCFELVDLEDLANELRSVASDLLDRLDVLDKIARSIDANGTLGKDGFGEKVRDGKELIASRAKELGVCATAIDKVVEEVRFTEEYALRLKNGGWEQLLQERFAQDTRGVQAGTYDHSMGTRDLFSIDTKYFGLQKAAKTSKGTGYTIELPHVREGDTKFRIKAGRDSGKAWLGTRVRIGPKDANVHFTVVKEMGLEEYFDYGLQEHVVGGQETLEGAFKGGFSLGSETVSWGLTSGDTTVDLKVTGNLGVGFGGGASGAEGGARFDSEIPVGPFGVGATFNTIGEAERPLSQVLRGPQ